MSWANWNDRSIEVRHGSTFNPVKPSSLSGPTVSLGKMRCDPRGDQANQLGYVERLYMTPIYQELTVNRIGGDVVTVLVGESRQKYTVHEQVLTEHSPFFAAAFQKEWKEGQERSIPLPDDDPEVFGLYAQWIYGGKIFSRKLPIESPSISRELDLLIDSYVFGEKVQDDDYKDALLDSLLACTNSKDEKGHRYFPSGRMVQRAYEKTLTRSPIRQLLVDMHNHEGESGWIKDDNSVEFLADLTREMFITRGPPVGSNLTDWNVSSCVYHHHGKDKQCYSSVEKEVVGTL